MDQGHTTVVVVKGSFVDVGGVGVVPVRCLRDTRDGVTPECRVPYKQTTTQGSDMGSTYPPAVSVHGL